MVIYKNSKVIISHFVFFSSFLALLTSCSTPSSMNECKINVIIHNYIEESTNTKERRDIKEKFDNVLKDWAENKISMLIYQKYDYEIPDIVLFNEEKNKVLLFSIFIGDKGHGNVDLHAGERKEDGLWYFHHSGLPGYSYRYVEEYRKGKAFTNHELLVRSLDKLADDGLVKKNSISQDYINTKWF